MPCERASAEVARLVQDLDSTPPPPPGHPWLRLAKDYLYLHREHNDWVTQLHFIPEIGLVTSSLDTTIKAGWAGAGCGCNKAGALLIWLPDPCGTTTQGMLTTT